MLLSLIYPIHITNNTEYIVKRIDKCLSNTIDGLKNALVNVEHIFVLSGEAKFTQIAEKIINSVTENTNDGQPTNQPQSPRKQTSLKICHWDKPTSPYSPGSARNIGLKEAQGEHVLFWDIDLLGSPALFSAIAKHQEKLQKQTQAFFMYPCLYLTPYYSKRFYHDFEQAYSDVIQQKTNTIEHIALATSTLLCNKQHLANLGAFDETFNGHMGEDLELINRLAIAYNKFPLREDHLIDAPSKIPNRLKGFRRLFAHYALPHFEQQQFSIHIAHSTKLGSKYKKNQATNMDYFQKKMKAAIVGFELSPVEENSLGDKKYLNSAPPIALSRMERWQKKWQKLRRDPPLFFRDMF